jgi:hypothetical protein
MKKPLIVTIVVVLAACKVQKTGQDTYKVVVPTRGAKAAGAKAKVEAQAAAEKIKQEARKLGDKVKTETTSTHH